MANITEMFPELELIKDSTARDKLRKALTSAMKGDGSALKRLALYKEIPVSFEKFITDPQYLNYVDDSGRPILYSTVMLEMIKLNDGDYIEAVFTGGIGCGKALSLDTPIPTPTGHTLMGELNDGDKVLGSDFRPTTITTAHPPYKAKSLYNVEFSSGDVIKADGEHLWEVSLGDELPTVMNTTTLWDNHSKGVRITITPPKCLAQARGSAPINTSHYCIGAWVAAGKRNDPSIYTTNTLLALKLSSQTTISWEHSHQTKDPHYLTVSALLRDLKTLQCLKERNIPMAAKYWSTAQKEQFILGMALASDGVVVTTEVIWKNALISILSSVGIGFKVSHISKVHKSLPISGWSIAIYLDPTNDRHTYECKALQITERPDPTIQLLGITQIPSEMVRCITVDSRNSLYLSGHSLVPTHNTTAALATIAYQLYKVSCLENPQAYFGLDPSSEIVFIFQSVTEKIAKAVNYARFKALMDKSPYFKTKFPYNRDIESELQFPSRIYVKPVSATDTSTIGQNIFAGIIDEINFFDVIDNSKRKNNGGTYDHAVELYNSMASRRKSRFLVNGVVQGILCLVSSKNYPNDFTERKEKEAKTDSTIFVYSKRIWEIKPNDYTQGWFTIFIGDLHRPPRIIEDANFIIPDGEAMLYDRIPLEFESDFRRDMMRHLRETAGIATMSLHPFIMDSTKIFDACISKSILSRTVVDFVDTQVEISTLDLKNPTAKRWIHMDLALTGDSAGVVMGHIERFVKVARGDTFEVLPYFVIDFTLEVAPPIGSEIQFWKIRELIYAMRDQLGINIGWISLDTYQSADTMQILRSKGFKAGVQSIDRTTAPYEVVKQALYDGRVEMPYHERLGVELAQLEMDTKKGKVDHPSRGSKDVADALAGVMYGLITRGDLWFEAGITPNSIPTTVRALTSSNMDKT